MSHNFGLINVHVEWYVAGFPEKMGFQIQQTRSATLREAMEVEQNYNFFAQSLQKSLKQSKEKERKHRRRMQNHNSTSETSSNSK